VKSFYTYMWLREDGTPYYVGKGTGNRAFRKGSPPVDRILLQEFPSERDALEAEKFLISWYGRKDRGTGILYNENDGGFGGDTFSGRRHSPSAIERMREWKPTEGTKRRMSSAAKRRGAPVIATQQAALVNKGRKHPADCKHCEAARQMWKNPEIRTGIIESLKGNQYAAGNRGWMVREGIAS
jgi:hypothetical protein